MNYMVESALNLAAHRALDYLDGQEAHVKAMRNLDTMNRLEAEHKLLEIRKAREQVLYAFDMGRAALCEKQ